MGHPVHVGALDGVFRVVVESVLHPHLSRSSSDRRKKFMNKKAFE